MRRGALILALGFVLTGCVQTATGSASYHLSEFEVDGPGQLTGNVGPLTISNSGEFPHTLVIAESDGTVIAATDLIQPGQTVELDVELEPGEYQFSCRIVGQKPDGTIVDHYEEGMVRNVSVGS